MNNGAEPKGSPSALFTTDMADSAKLHIEEARADMTGQHRP
jgi:hypothetical protein